LAIAILRSASRAVGSFALWADVLCCEALWAYGWHFWPVPREQGGESLHTLYCCIIAGVMDLWTCRSGTHTIDTSRVSHWLRQDASFPQEMPRIHGSAHLHWRDVRHCSSESMDMVVGTIDTARRRPASRQKFFNRAYWQGSSHSGRADGKRGSGIHVWRTMQDMGDTW